MCRCKKCPNRTEDWNCKEYDNKPIEKIEDEDCPIEQEYWEMNNYKFRIAFSEFAEKTEYVLANSYEEALENLFKIRNFVNYEFLGIASWQKLNGLI